MRRWLHGWLAVWLGALTWGCRTPPAEPPPAPPPRPPSVWDTPAEMLRPAPSAFTAAVPYQPPAAVARLPEEPPSKPGLAGVANLKAFASLGADERRLLEIQGFAAKPVADPQLDAVYRANLADRVPGFVTADAVLYAYHRLCEDTLRRLDAQILPERLTRLTTALLARTQAQYEEAAGAEWKEAARRNLAWLSVAASLLGLNVHVESGAAELATGELQLIAAHEGWRPSRIFPYELDYSVFIRRDVYTATEVLARYAEALTWFAATPFATRYENDGGQTVDAWPVVRQELLLAHALGCPPEAPLRDWEALADARAFLTGRPRDPGVSELLAAAEEAFGRVRSARAYDDFGKLQTFVAKLAARTKPPLLPPARQPNRPGPVQFRLLGPPDAPDEEILTELAGPVRRAAAAGLDVFAVLGQPRAEELLRRLDRSTVANEPFQTTFLRLRERLGAVDAATWQSNPYWGRLWAAAPLCEAAGPGRPRFQRQPAWQDRALLTSLAGWAALRHRTWLAVPKEPAAPAHIAVVSDPPPGGEPRRVRQLRRVPAAGGGGGAARPGAHAARAAAAGGGGPRAALARGRAGRRARCAA
ncbi:MAG: DUF3160 domain-containing protein [Armatimonadetes bacterium]|nr:DUF3160 domain-containing protein [Armatimonadota bacterium]